MNNQALIDAINDAKDRIAYDGYRQRADIKLIVEVLEKEPKLKVYDGGWLYNGIDHASKVEFGDLANWLIDEVLTGRSPASVVKSLYTFINNNRANSYIIYALTGFNVDEIINLTDDITIMPFSKLPASLSTDIFPISSKYTIESWPMPTKITPSVAITKRYEANPVMVDKDKRSSFHKAQPNHHPIERELMDVCLVLTLIGPCAPIALASWKVFADDIPLAIKGGEAIHLVEIPPYNPPKIGEFDPTEASKVIKSYRKMDKAEKEKLRIPIERLNLAIRRMRNEDRAIELGISLESLLIEKELHDVRIADTMGHRAAYINGGNKDTRREIYKLVKDLYRLRSSAAHSGKKMDSSKKKLILKGISRCASLIKTVIDNGGIPQWDDLFLEKIE